MYIKYDDTIVGEVELLGDVYDYTHFTNWQNEAYRTVTFLESPSGELLTWLQASAVKQ